MSITQIAKHAGVSRATVFRVINRVGNVSPDTVRLVHQAMERLDYHPKAKQRGRAASGRYGKQGSREGVSMISLILPEVKIGLYSPLQYGFSDALDPSRFQVTVRTSANDVYQQSDAIMQAIHAEPDGIAMLPVSSEDTPAYHVLLMQKLGIPVVLLHRRVKDAKAPAFVLPLDKAGQYMVNMALEHGHRRVATFLSGRDSSTESICSGVKSAFVEAGYDFSGSMFFYHHGRTIAISSDEEVLLDNHLDSLLAIPKDKRPTAIITGNNQLAEAIWLRLLERGVRVPEDISIITFRAKESGGGVRDHFAAVTFGAEEVGRQAAEVLSEMIHNERDIDDTETFEIELAIEDGKTLTTPS